MKRILKRLWSLLLCAAIIFTILPFSTLRASAAETAYSVTYDSNGAASGSVPTDSNTYTQNAAVQVSDNTGNLSKPGFSFGGWMTNDTIYHSGNKLTMGTANVTLFAAWIRVYTVTYNGNSASGGPAPVDTGKYPDGAYTKVLSGDNFSGFKHWNTKADGSGISYDPGNALSVTSDITLYAIWDNTPFLPLDGSIVYYDANGATEGTVPPGSKTNPVTISGNTGSLLKTGFFFVGWNTNADGSGTTYQLGKQVPFSSPTTLYAKWVPAYTVTYQPNAGTLSVPAQAVTLSYAPSSALKLLDYNTSFEPPTGKVFIGWNTKADGSGTKYMSGDVVFAQPNLTFYAIYDSCGSYKTITYRGNGNTEGSAPFITRFPAGAKYTMPTQGTLKRENYMFAGWFDAYGFTYHPGDSVTATEDTIYYAKWVPAYTLVYDGNGAYSGTVPTDTGTYTTGAQAKVADNTGNLSAPNVSFDHWNTKSDGTGTSYTPGSTITVTANTTLYAIYTSGVHLISFPQYTIIYYPNGADSGTVPAPDTGNNSKMTIKGNTGGLSKSGYAFAGWWTTPASFLADQHPQLVNAGDVFQFPENQTTVEMFPMWVSGKKYFTYNGNGNTGGKAPDPSVSVCDCGTLYKTGYTFVGWNTFPDGSGKNFSAGESYDNQKYRVFYRDPLYAQWTPVATYYNVSYINQSTKDVTVPAMQSLEKGSTFTLGACTINQPGVYFSGYYTVDSNNQKTFYRPGDKLTMGSSDITFYAIFDTTPRFFVYYNANGGDPNSVPIDKRYYGECYQFKVSYTIPTAPDSAHYFAGWNTKPDGTGTTYQPGDMPRIGVEDVTLYACWKTYSDAYQVTYSANGSTSGALSVTNALCRFNKKAILPDAGSLAKTGYIFSGWSVLGSVYQPGDSFIMPSGPVTVTAVWGPVNMTADTCTISYSGNGASGGTVPIDNTAYLANGFATIRSNTGNLSKTGYVFCGWSDGSKLYKPGQAYTIANPVSTVIFYAVWQPAHTITYYGNNNSGGSVPINLTAYVTNQSVVLPNGGSLTRTGYLFDGWSIGGKLYQPGDTYVFGSDNVMVTAVWVKLPTPSDPSGSSTSSGTSGSSTSSGTSGSSTSSGTSGSSTSSGTSGSSTSSGTSGSSTSSGTSGSSTSSGTSTSGTTTTTTTDNNGTTVTTATTAPDAPPTVTDHTASVSVTVPADAAATAQNATPQKPAQVKIILPDKAVAEQLKKDDVKTVEVTVAVPSTVANGTNPSADVTITAGKDLLQAAKDGKKDVTLSVTDSGTGRVAYSWTFKGSNLADSTAPMKDVDLALTVQPVKDVPQVGAAASSADSGIVLTFGNNGVLPAPAEVKIYVGNQGYHAGQTLFFYYFNPVTQKLEKVNDAVCTVDENGYATVKIAHCSDYVLLPQQVAEKTGSITLDTRSYTMSPKNIYDIGVKLENAQNVTVKVHSSRDSIAKVTKLANGNYRITGLKQSVSYVIFEIYDKNGKLLNHASVKITVANGVKPHGEAVRAKSVF